MDEIVFDVLMKYENVLSKMGWISSHDEKCVILLVIIQELISGDIHGYLTPEDYEVLTSLLYQLFESSCLIGYYDVNSTTLQSNTTTMGELFDLYSVSMSSLASRLNTLENSTIVVAE